jgi:glucose/arabinose dehydrogenase
MKALPATRVIYGLTFSVLLVFGACDDDSEGTEELPFGLTSEVVATAPHVSEIVFAPDGRMFFSEQFTGDIRIVMPDGTLQQQPFAHLDVANWLDLDWGLTGLALDPGFESNHYVYAFYTKPVPLPDGQGQTSPSAVPVESTPSAEVTPPSVSTPGDGPPPIQTAPGGQPMATGATTAPASTEQAPANPVGQPVLVRFTERNGVGEELTVISENFPVTVQAKAGYNANGSIHFGPDGMLYASMGDYDFATDPVALDLSSPIGKMLRINATTGEAPPDNPLVQEPGADPRVFAFGFREPFDFVFQPQTQVIFGTDNTPYTCEELNVIRGGENYGWPAVGEFPYAQCGIGEQVVAIHFFAREGKQPGDFVSLVEVAGLTFTPAARYPALGDSLFVCEGQRSVVDGEESPGVLRRLVIAPDLTGVTANDLIVRDCKGDAEAAADGTLYYANSTEIRRLLPATTSVPAEATGATSP